MNAGFDIGDTVCFFSERKGQVRKLRSFVIRDYVCKGHFKAYDRYELYTKENEHWNCNHDVPGKDLKTVKLVLLEKINKWDETFILEIRSRLQREGEM